MIMIIEIIIEIIANNNWWFKSYRGPRPFVIVAKHMRGSRGLTTPFAFPQPKESALSGHQGQETDRSGAAQSFVGFKRTKNSCSENIFAN